MILYSTLGCHLCEHAEEILQQEHVAYHVVDIAETDHLLQRYGVRIPVVVDDAGRELGWPFDATQLRAFIQAP